MGNRDRTEIVESDEDDGMCEEHFDVRRGGTEVFCYYTTSYTRMHVMTRFVGDIYSWPCDSDKNSKIRSRGGGIYGIGIDYLRRFLRDIRSTRRVAEVNRDGARVQQEIESDDERNQIRSTCR